MTDLRGQYEQYLKSLDLVDMLKKALLTDSCGITWDSWRDYELYGDMFPRITIKDKQMNTDLTLKVQKTLTAMNRHALLPGSPARQIDEPSVYWGAMQGYLLALKHMGMEDESKVIFSKVRGCSPDNVYIALNEIGE